MKRCDRRPQSHETGRGPDGIFSTEIQELWYRHDTKGRNPMTAVVPSSLGHDLVKNNQFS